MAHDYKRAVYNTSLKHLYLGKTHANGSTYTNKYASQPYMTIEKLQENSPIRRHIWHKAHWLKKMPNTPVRILSRRYISTTSTKQQKSVPCYHGNLMRGCKSVKIRASWFFTHGNRWSERSTTKQFSCPTCPTKNLRCGDRRLKNIENVLTAFARQLFSQAKQTSILSIISKRVAMKAQILACLTSFILSIASLSSATQPNTVVATINVGVTPADLPSRPTNNLLILQTTITMGSPMATAWVWSTW